MPHLNRVTIMGHLGQDPEVKYTQSGNAVANFSVAAAEKWKDKSGEPQEHTEWFRVSAWGKLAEICGQYLTKGAAVYIEGKLRTRKWQDKDGQDRYTTEVIASSMQMLGGKGERTESRSSQPPPAPSDDSFDDDTIPF